MLEDTADDFWQTLKSFLDKYHLSSLVSTLYRAAVLLNITAKNPFLSAVQANLYLKKMFDYTEI